MKTIKCAELNLLRNSPSLGDILEWAVRRHRIDRMFVTIYTDRVRGKWKPRYGQAEKETVELFEPFILRVFLANACPPHYYYRHPHLVCVVRYTRQVGKIMLKRQADINGWTNGDGLPEGICLFNSRSKLPAFVSSIHDNEGWLIDASGIEGDFFDEWEGTPRTVRKRLQIWSGYAFCQPWISQRHVSTKWLTAWTRPNGFAAQ